MKYVVEWLGNPEQLTKEQLNACVQFMFGMHAVLLGVIVESCLISGIKVEIIQIQRDLKDLT
jgi:hypothetical protein